MGPDRELRVRAVTLATVTLLLKDDDDKRFLSSDSKEVFECLLLNSRRPPRRTEVPRIPGYAETVVPQYSLSDFHQHFRMSCGTFELLTGIIRGCRKPAAMVGDFQSQYQSYGAPFVTKRILTG